MLRASLPLRGRVIEPAPRLDPGVGVTTSLAGTSRSRERPPQPAPLRPRRTDHNPCAEIGWAKTVKHPTADELAASLPGRTVEGVERRAKYLLFPLAGQPPATFAAHLGMTGNLLVQPREQPAHPMTRHAFALDDGTRTALRRRPQVRQAVAGRRPCEDPAAPGPGAAGRRVHHRVAGGLAGETKRSGEGPAA